MFPSMYQLLNNKILRNQKFLTTYPVYQALGFLIVKSR